MAPLFLAALFGCTALSMASEPEACVASTATAEGELSSGLLQVGVSENTASMGVTTTTTPDAAPAWERPSPPDPRADGGVEPALELEISHEDLMRHPRRKVKRWALSIHNKYRRRHCNTPRLKWDNQLANDAEGYARTCPKGHATDRNGAGENLAWAGSSNSIEENRASWEKALKGWYDEIKDWNYAASQSSGGDTGHFTAMVWKETTKVGCAMNVKCNNQWSGMTNNVVVCRYKKHPNMQGEYASNVEKLKEGSSC